MEMFTCEKISTWQDYFQLVHQHVVGFIVLEVKMINSCFSKAKAIQKVFVKRIILSSVSFGNKSMSSCTSTEQALCLLIYTVQNSRFLVSIKHGLQAMDYELQTANCRLYGLDKKHGLRYKMWTRRHRPCIKHGFL